MDCPKWRKTLEKEEQEDVEDVDRYSKSHAISAPPKFVRDHKQSERGRGEERCRGAGQAFDNRFTIMCVPRALMLTYCMQFKLQSKNVPR